ncbi:hypothetical protein CHS0354_016752 [Potamilus streckersoni]|uniref:Uncharacterized protein n=1 Tax=Potamilus streckersoni TaxID=2493646 RepID=A0AAE0WA46_9BIVA|nr:hypothetical protein CHS0354_016752 [Potamilus streckersoni]
MERTSRPKLAWIKSQPERYINHTMPRDNSVHSSQLTFSGKTKVVINCQRTCKNKREETKSRHMSIGSESQDVLKYNLAIIDKDRIKRRQKIAQLQEMASKLNHDAVKKQHLSVKSALSSQVALLNSLRKFSSLTKGNEVFSNNVASRQDQTEPKGVLRKSSVVLQMTTHNIGPVKPAWPERKRSSANESPTNSEILRELAILKVREKYEAELNLPADRYARLIKLRQNVERIQKKFATLAREHNRQEHSDAPNEEDFFENEENLLTPSRFAQPGEVSL